jgi:hypothetical protein
MPDSNSEKMADRRALLTERERDIISGEAEVSDNYKYQTVSRVRRRLSKLQSDIEALEQHGELLEELREVVCKDREE